MTPNKNWFGITRVASQGTLDRSGISVWSAIRPNSRSLCITNGKALTDSDARQGAVFEAIECACAEDSDWLVKMTDSIEGMQTRGLHVIGFSDFAAARHPRPARTSDRHWVLGQELGTGQEIYAPFQMVGLDFRLRTDQALDTFVMTSVGLAAHYDRNAALVNSLLEVIENDAIAMVVDVPGEFRRRDQINSDSLPLLWLKELKSELRETGWALKLYDFTSSLGLPTIFCLLEKLKKEEVGSMSYGGFACRGNEIAAVSAAILEAVQSKVTDIAGARDDITAEHYQSTNKRYLCTGRVRDAVHSGLSDIPALERIEQALSRDATVGTPIVFDLAPRNIGIHCVRVLVPGLELVNDGCRPRRLRRFRAKAFSRSLNK